MHNYFCFDRAQFFRSDILLNNSLLFSPLFSDKNLPPGFPRITESPSMKVIETGRNALLQCQARGDPTVNIYWVKDTMRLKPNPRYTVMEQGKLRGERVGEQRRKFTLLLSEQKTCTTR